MKRTSIAALAVLFAAPALAQTVPAPAPTTPAPAASARPSGQYYTSQPDQMRASKLIGTKIVNNANETVGDISELILDKDGKVAAVVVSVGGFLGIGAREVALDYKSFTIKHDPTAMTDSGATVVTLDVTKDSLAAAPAWTWNRDKTTGGTPAPSTSRDMSR